jgi:hypothetical protein
VAASSRKWPSFAARALFCAASTACSVGHGEGEISGTVQVAGCREQGRYDLSPSAFFAQTTEQLLRIRVQRGGDLEVKSDGLAILVEDASLVKKKYLGRALSLAPGTEPRIDVSVYLNESCSPGRDQTPVVLGAVSGTVRFEEIYAPQVDAGDVEISATIENVRFEDPRNADRWAELSGDFQFLYVRGSPAQRFP